MLRPWQVRLGERLDPSRATPIYMQIIQALIRDIESGRLVSGTFLPSSRELAAMLGVNRKTVVLAYEDLIAQGWLVSAGTRGTMVSTSLPELSRTEAPLPEGCAVEADYEFLAPPDRALAIPAGMNLKLDEGAPDGRLFPAAILTRAYRTAINRASRENRLQYRDPRGSPKLREGIATMLKIQRGLQVTAENICITRGSQNGIFLASQVLVRPGDAVIVEHLTYEPAVAAFLACGAKIIPVPVDGEGIDVEAVEAAARRNAVRAVFLTPHHQFPTTVALRPERRLRLLDLSRQFGFAVIEDDYDHEFHFETQPLLPMAAYAPRQVIYVGSLSKLLLPTLRIGYLVAPPPVVNAVAHRVSLTDGMGNTLTEDAAAELIANGELRRHARKVHQIYAERREAFARELDRAFGDRIRYRMPDGGLAFWLQFEGDLDRIEERVAAAGLSFASSRSFMTSEAAERGLRIGFASLDTKEARAAIEALHDAVFS